MIETDDANAERTSAKIKQLTEERDRLRAALAKLREQKPVGEIDDSGCHSGFSRSARTNQALPIGTELFLNPAPIPEGWRCPVCNTDLKNEHSYNCVAAARSEG